MIAPNASIVVEDSPPTAGEGAAGEGQENLSKNASCSSDEAAGISCLELEAWIKDDGSMDCMMLLPEVPLDEDSPSSGSMQECDNQQLHSPSSNNLCCGDEQCLSHEASIFCRSSSSCSSTFPDVDARQETLELTLPDDFFEDKHQSAAVSQDQEMILPPLSDHHQRSSSSSPRACDLKKIIVKKPVMDKAVERLGGGRRGALRLWNIIQVWLRYQQQGIPGCPPALDGFLMQGNELLGFDQQQNHHQQQQNHQVYPGFGSNAWDPGMITQAQAQQQQQQQQQMGFPELENHHHVGLPGPSAAATTRAARKSRMARQRRNRAGNGAAAMISSPAAAAPSPAPTTTTAACSWSSSSSFVSGSIRSLEVQPQQQFSASRDKEKASIKFLLQKELKPSDVGNLGRIVLPKERADT